MAGLQTFIDEVGAHRIKDLEFVYPVIVGTVAFPLGKKVGAKNNALSALMMGDRMHANAQQQRQHVVFVSPELGLEQATDAASHRWTVYLRGINNEDLSHIISRVQFDLHPTFNNANRVVEQQPFEVTEHGWGEFEIVVHINFSTDSGEAEAIMYHRLKLYEDGEQVGVKQDPKRPVVTETYEELVFSEPRLEFYSRIKQTPQMPLNPPSQLVQFFRVPNEAEELEAIRAMRARVGQMTADLRREMGPSLAAPMSLPAGGPAGAAGGVVAPPPPGTAYAGGAAGMQQQQQHSAQAGGFGAQQPGMTPGMMMHPGMMQPVMGHYG